MCPTPNIQNKLLNEKQIKTPFCLHVETVWKRQYDNYLNEMGFLSSGPFTTTPVAPPDLTAKTWEKKQRRFTMLNSERLQTPIPTCEDDFCYAPPWVQLN